MVSEKTLEKARLLTGAGRFSKNLLRKLFSSKHLAITAIFRDEAQYLDEWVRFHLHQGVTKFYLFDDGSSDSPETVLESWMRQGVVTLQKALPADQEATYNLSLKRNRWRTKWMAFIDIDEFLFCPSGEKLTALLPLRPGIAGIFVFWKLFGSSGLLNSPKNGVLESYTKSLPSPGTPDELRRQVENHRRIRADGIMTGAPFQGKSIVNPRLIRKMGIHSPQSWRGHLVDEAGRELPSPFFISALPSDYLPSNNRFRLNHYWSKSLEDLRKKATGPLASKGLREDNVARVRSLSSYIEWDLFINQEVDLTLLRQWRKVSGPYIFVIGFNKTATRSLAHFFTANGLPAVHWDENKLVDRMLKNLENRKPIFAGYDAQYRVFSDLISITSEKKIEGNQFFREMNRDYPGSYFILNNRDTEDWVQSRAAHAKGKFLSLQLSILNSSNPEDAFTLWRKEKKNHDRAVREYFAGSTHFLELPISSSDVPGTISTFLGMAMDREEWKQIGRTRTLA